MIPENTLAEEANNELNKTKEIERMGDRENLVCRKKKNIYIYIYGFENFWTINSFS